MTLKEQSQTLDDPARRRRTSMNVPMIPLVSVCCTISIIALRPFASTAATVSWAPSSAAVGEQPRRRPPLRTLAAGVADAVAPPVTT
jgi:hypothetical protein